MPRDATRRRSPRLPYDSGAMRRTRHVASPSVRGCCRRPGVLAAGCADPPTKEMNQAQGAIDAARAAGAEQFAADEFQAAVDALKRRDEAVDQRDYRLALSLALDSRERAQDAAKRAADAEGARSAASVIDCCPTAPSSRLESTETALRGRAARAPPRSCAHAAKRDGAEQTAAIARSARGARARATTPPCAPPWTGLPERLDARSLAKAMPPAAAPTARRGADGQDRRSEFHRRRVGDAACQTGALRTAAGRAAFTSVTMTMNADDVEHDAVAHHLP